jgi:hypothetical protein
MRDIRIIEVDVWVVRGFRCVVIVGSGIWRGCGRLLDYIL